MPTAGSKARLARLHAGLVAAVVICTGAFVFEVLRASGGNTLSWAYVVEWPILLGYAVYMWRRLVREERGGTGARPRRAPDYPQDAATLDAWNRYLADLHAADAASSRPPRSPEGAPPAGERRS
jgi:aminoglycoside phosphotransferase (APT) family kinase protein